MRGEQRHAGDEGRGQRSDQQSQNEWDRLTQHAPYRLFPARRVMQNSHFEEGPDFQDHAG